MERSTSYVFYFRMVFFYLITTGWIFDISLLCENSIDQSINQSIKYLTYSITFRMKDHEREALRKKIDRSVRCDSY